LQTSKNDTPVDFNCVLIVGMKSLTGEDQNHEVFAYSIFYVYYEQYLTIWRDTIVSLSISFCTIFVISFFLMGFNIGSALVIILTIFMIVIDLLGLLYFWNISLNAISLVNLVMVQ